MIEFLSFWCSRLLIVFLAIATLIPFLPTGAWFVRLLDFPRVQLLVVAMIAFIAMLIHVRATREFPWHTFAASAVWLGVVLCQSWYVAPFTRIWPKDLEDTKSNSSVKLMVANIKVSNDRQHDVIQVLEKHAPDILLLIEIDDAWYRSLQHLAQRYVHHCNVIREDGVGIALWSKLPLHNTEVRHLVSDQRASIFATLQLHDGNFARIACVHPTPPGLPDDEDEGRHDSRIRDAELMLVAKEVRQDSSLPWIVAGDFNDVAWSHTTRLFKRQSGLKDPRVGRKLLNTYHAEYPGMRYPIDQLFLAKGSTIQQLERVYLPGSDHFAVVVSFRVPTKGTENQTNSEDQQEAKELIREGRDDTKD